MITRLLFVVCIVVGVVAAQSAPPRKDIPAIAKAANDRGQAPAKVSDAFAKAEVLALQAIEKEDYKTLVTRPDGSFVTRSDAALDVAKAEAVSPQEKLIGSFVEKLSDYRVASDYPLEVLEKSPTLEKDVKGFSSRVNACISAEKDALRRRAAELPEVCNDDIISPPRTKEELAALQRKIKAEVQSAERAAATVAANDPERQAPPQSAPPRRDIPAIAKAANGAIVSIVMSDKDGHAIAQGSGFLIGQDGVILTNYHVIAEGSSAVVKFPEGAVYVVDGVLASDKSRDIVVIKAHGQTFRTLALGDSDRVQVGEDVVAIGNPLSLESTVSNGIVSGIRAVEEEGGKYLQITAPISPGSSGGPLFNMAGEVIGITTMYLKGGENLNFAIPINDAKRLLLAESTQIQALPNESGPTEVETHTGGATSPVAPPPAQSPVEHAATTEQCEADARVWISQPTSFVKQLPHTELQNRALEMGDCFVVGARDELTVRTNVRYVAASNLYNVEMISRMTGYIARHDPWSQYMSERVPVLSITQDPPAHAPSPKQCRADELLWTQQNQTGTVNGLSANELYARPNEMLNCANEIHGTDFLAAATFVGYFSTKCFYNAVIIEQLHAYLLHHNEWTQFLSEDAAGVR